MRYWHVRTVGKIAFDDWRGSYHYESMPEDTMRAYVRSLIGKGKAVWVRPLYDRRGQWERIEPR